VRGISSGYSINTLYSEVGQVLERNMLSYEFCISTQINKRKIKIIERDMKPVWGR
jgi:hypothetical protein